MTMPVGIELGGMSRRRRRGGAFVPYQLFANNEPGGWYDPSDFSTMFQGITGSATSGTPVTAVEQPVGFMLDKSRGGLAAIGPDTIVNGTFDVDADWTKGTDWTIGSGVATKVAGVSSSLAQGQTLVPGRYYLLTYTMTCTGGTLTPRFLGGTTVTAQFRSVSGTYTDILLAATGNTTLQFLATSTFAGTVDNVTLRLMPSGNHVSASADARRPILRARYNLLERTEEFNDVYWSKSQATVAQDAEIAPNGAFTADKIIVGTGLLNGNCNTFFSFVAGQSYRLSAYAKIADTFNIVAFTVEGNAAISFNLSTQATTILQQINGWTITNPQMVSVGNGWIRYSATFNAGTTTTVRVRMAEVRHTGDGTSGVYFWGADLRVANDGVGLPVYQRVTTATDYDTAGFPPYLAFDGVDDCLFTAGNVEFATWTGVEARRNLLLVPSQFDATTWTKTNATIQANVVVAPDGTLSGDSLINNSTNGEHRVLSNAVSPTINPGTASVFAKAGSASFISVGTSGFSHSCAVFDLSTGTISNQGANVIGSSMVDVGDGWYRCSVSVAFTSTYTIVNIGETAAQAIAQTSYVGTGKNVYLWGAQLELGTTATAFQNVGTDQVTVVAGVRKNNNTVNRVVELSAIVNNNNGSFTFGAPFNAFSESYGSQSKGSTAAVSATTPTTFVAPITNIVTTLAQINTDTLFVRVNGTQQASSTTDQGSGNYGNYPLFVGARDNASARFNGRLYGLIVTGRVLTTPTLEQSEAWMNQRTEAY